MNSASDRLVMPSAIAVMQPGLWHRTSNTTDSSITAVIAVPLSWEMDGGAGFTSPGPACSFSFNRYELTGTQGKEADP